MSRTLIFLLSFWVCTMTLLVGCPQPSIELDGGELPNHQPDILTSERRQSDTPGQERRDDGVGLPDKKAQDSTTKDQDHYERPADLPAGRCRISRDCSPEQSCDVKLGRCFSDCTKGAICFQGDRCIQSRQRCVCESVECGARGGFCHRTLELCKLQCEKDEECPMGFNCQQTRCHQVVDGGPPEPSLLEEGDDCSGGQKRCGAGLFCVKTNTGPELCLRACDADKDCRAPSQCSPGLLANGRGVCGTLVAEGATCETAKRQLCQPGFRCYQGLCIRRPQVGIFDQCDTHHLCRPSTLVCVSFGNAYGSLCLQSCVSTDPKSCPQGQQCLVSGQGTKGVCLGACTTAQDACPHPFLACNPVGSGLVCTPKGNQQVNPFGQPCGGPYGQCATPLKCEVIYASTSVGLCTQACPPTCPQGTACMKINANKTSVCLKTCTGYNGTCPKGFFCTPGEKGWFCAP